jgi:hypothetical protein
VDSACVRHLSQAAAVVRCAVCLLILE